MKRDILRIGFVGGLAAAWCALGAWTQAAPPEKKPPAKKPAKPVTGKATWEAGPFMGEYAGTFNPDRGLPMPATAQVVGTGAAAYNVRLATTPPETQPPLRVEFSATASGEWIPLSAEVDKLAWSGKLEGGRLKLAGKGAGGGTFDLARAARRSLTEGAEPPAGAVVLLAKTDGKPSLDPWTNKDWKTLDGGVMEIAKGDNFTVAKLRDFKLHLEFRLPYEPEGSSQGRANSGVYIHDRYEVQILDSFGQAPANNGCASIYTLFPPKTNECFPPLAWQTYDITFHAPRLDGAGKVLRLPKITVVHNGATVHQDREIPSPTGAAKSKGHAESNPLKLQDHNHPVQFRNIWLVELKDEAGTGK